MTAATCSWPVPTDTSAFISTLLVCKPLLVSAFALCLWCSAQDLDLLYKIQDSVNKVRWRSCCFSAKNDYIMAGEASKRQNYCSYASHPSLTLALSL